MDNLVRERLLANQRRSRNTLLSALGVALALPLIAVPASAALDGGGFLVHAQNTEDARYQATAGAKGSTQGGGSGGGSTTPGGGSGADNPGGAADSTRVLADYQCGPMGLKITQAMVDFSKANESQTPKSSSDGWQSISSYSSATNKVALGYPDSGPKAPLVTLSDSMAVPAPLQFSDATKAFAYEEGGMCQILDRRSVPRAGERLTYTAQPSYDPAQPERNYYSEARWVSEDGELRPVSVSKQSDGRITVNRHTTSLLGGYAKSDTKPTSLALSDDGSFVIEAHRKTTLDGANNIYLRVEADGSGQLMYRYYKGQTADGQQDIDYAPRKNGPVALNWDSSGVFTSLRSYDSNENFGDSAFTVAKYNELTGQNWDGSYLKGSDFDLTLPFQATPPN